MPLLIAGAGVTRTGREDALTGTVDLYATILELAGLDVPQVFNSHSLVPLLTDENASTGRDHIFVDYDNAEHTNYRYAVIRNDDWKLAWRGPGSLEWGLYDLVNDPKENGNKYSYSAYATQRAELEALLADIAAEAPPGYFP